MTPECIHNRPSSRETRADLLAQGKVYAKVDASIPPIIDTPAKLLVVDRGGTCPVDKRNELMQRNADLARAAARNEQLAHALARQDERLVDLRAHSADGGQRLAARVRDDTRAAIARVSHGIVRAQIMIKALQQRADRSRDEREVLQHQAHQAQITIEVLQLKTARAEEERARAEEERAQLRARAEEERAQLRARAEEERARAEEERAQLRARAEEEQAKILGMMMEMRARLERLEQEQQVRDFHFELAHVSKRLEDEIMDAVFPKARSAPWNVSSLRNLVPLLDTDDCKTKERLAVMGKGRKETYEDTLWEEVNKRRSVFDSSDVSMEQLRQAGEAGYALRQQRNGLAHPSTASLEHVESEMEALGARGLVGEVTVGNFAKLRDFHTSIVICGRLKQ